MTLGLDDFQRSRLRARLLEADALVVRPNAGFARDESDEATERLVAPLAGEDPAPFAEAPPPLVLADNSQARFFARRPDAEFFEAPPEVKILTRAAFERPGGETRQVLELLGVGFPGAPAGDRVDVVELVFRVDPPMDLTPDVFLHLLDAHGKLLRPIHLEARWRAPRPGVAKRPYGRVRFRLRDQIPPQLHARGFAIAAGVLGDDALTRWKVSTRSNSPVDEAEQRVLLFSPFTPAKTRETPR